METDRSGNIEGLSSPSDNTVLKHIDLSVCIVSYHACDFLRECLLSLYQNTDLRLEVFVVDNGSQDNVEQMLAQEFPQVHFHANTFNDGYTRPMNLALRQARGDFLLQLNPDTLILPQSLDRLVAFMQKNPQIGICGPKVLNSDWTLQKPCRRGESRPWAVITYFTGMSALFPRSKLFGQYLMGYMDENLIHPVAGVSGSCMLARRQVFEQIGFLDERFFAYQEDADFCFRARQAGWQIYYMPEAQIIHYGGKGGSRIEPYRSIFEWHRSYFRYYRKNLARDYFFLFNWLYFLAMGLKLVSALVANFFYREKPAILIKIPLDQKKADNYN
jgi:GT2 family glycosyltransferase